MKQTQLTLSVKALMRIAALMLALAIALMSPLPSTGTSTSGGGSSGGGSTGGGGGSSVGTTDQPQSSPLYVQAIDGLSKDFIRGVDISSYLAERASGVTYQDYDGKVLDDAGFFKLLADSGVNWVRLRVWNDPYDADGKGYGGGNCDLAAAKTMGKLATDAGLKVLIDFHYSDFWADPSKQQVPKAWANMSVAEKASALFQYTTDGLQQLLDAGVDVGMVQIGNETNSGMAGEKGADVYALMQAGCQAVREVAKGGGKDIQIALHYTNVNSSNFISFCDNAVRAGVDFDVFAASYYPFWHGSVENLTEKLTQIAQTYHKDVMVAETSWLYTMEDGDGFANSISADSSGISLTYSASPQGQANELRAVMAAVHAVGDAGLGIFYWEPAWIPVHVYDAAAGDADEVLAGNKTAWETYGSGWASSYAVSYDPNDAGQYYGGSSWDNQALFAFDGTPLESLRVFRFVFGGTTAANVVTGVSDIALDGQVGSPVELPKTVSATMTDDSIQELPVVWNAQQLAAAEQGGAGDYAIAGTASAGGEVYPLLCTVHMKAVNYVENPGFEDENMSMWTITGNGAGRDMDSNKHTGDYCLKFWSESPVQYTTTQTITGIPAGSYTLSGWLQGGDAGDEAVFQLFLTVNGEEYATDTGVSGWQNWSEPTVSNVAIPADAEVTVGVRVTAAAGAWGAWDDLNLSVS